MYSIDSDISFDDYTIDIDSDYLNEDFDVVEQNQDDEYNQTIDTDIKFE